MQNPFEPKVHLLDASGTIAADLPCRKCGYNLRGLSAEGRCPECGAAVGLSVQGNFLRYSEPRWVRKLSRGVKLIVIGIAIMVLALLAMIPLAMTRDYGMLGVVIAGLGFLAMYALWLIGAWMLTSPDPSGVGEDEYGTARRIIRIALAVGLGDALLTVIASSMTLHPQVRMLLDLIDIPVNIVTIIGNIALLQYLQKLALRVPDQKLSDRARFLKIAFSSAYGGAMILAALGNLLAGAGQPVVVFFGCVSGIAGLGVLIFGIMFLLMLEKLGKRFTEQARIAEETWARIEAGGGASALPVQPV